MYHINPFYIVYTFGNFNKTNLKKDYVVFDFDNLNNETIEPIITPPTTVRNDNFNVTHKPSKKIG